MDYNGEGSTFYMENTFDHSKNVKYIVLLSCEHMDIC